MPAFADECFGAVVADPPYGINVLPDGSPDLEWAQQCFRLLPPGGHVLAAADTRTDHRIKVALEMVGFEIRDTINWLYYTGMPKSRSVWMDIDKTLGVESPFESFHIKENPGANMRAGILQQETHTVHGAKRTPGSLEALSYKGHGTAINGAIEPFVMARKPIEGTLAQNALTYGGAGLLDIDATREHWDSKAWPGPIASQAARDRGHLLGRFPSNVVHVRKARHREKEAGCEGLPVYRATDVTGRKPGSAGANHPRALMRTRKPRRNHHMTIKPIDLMRRLVRLVHVRGMPILDTHCGSGSTMCAAAIDRIDSVGIELSEAYEDIAAARVRYWHLASQRFRTAYERAPYDVAELMQWT